MDFVMGPNPANWATGAPPPSPASEFTINTPPMVIAPPGKVPTSPSMAILKEEARKHRRLLRHIAFAMMTVAIVAIAAASFALWWFCLRKGAKTPDNGGVSQKSEREMKLLRKGSDLKVIWGPNGLEGSPDGQRNTLRGRKAQGQSIGGNTVVEVTGGLETSKKHPSISMLEVRTEEPKGTNTRIKEESTV